MTGPEDARQCSGREEVHSTERGERSKALRSHAPDLLSKLTNLG